MTNTKKHVSSDISTDIHVRWNNFMLAKHGSVKGPYGKELELAMKNHMNNFTNSNTCESKNVFSKTTEGKLKLLCLGFKALPTFPLIQPVTLNTLIKNNCNINDVRVINKYKKIVLTHSKEYQPSTEIFVQLDVDGFCKFVEKLTQEKFLKND